MPGLIAGAASLALMRQKKHWHVRHELGCLQRLNQSRHELFASATGPAPGPDLKPASSGPVAAHRTVWVAADLHLGELHATAIKHEQATGQWATGTAD